MIFSTILSKTALIVRTIHWHIITAVGRSTPTAALIPVLPQWHCNSISTGRQSVLKYPISRKSAHWESSCSTRTDGRTHRYDEADSCFSQVCELGQKLLFRTGAVLRTFECWQLSGGMAITYFISSIKQSTDSLLPSSKTLDPKDTRPTVCRNVGNSLPHHVVSPASNTTVCWRMKDQLHVTCYFISLIMRSTYFGH